MISWSNRSKMSGEDSPKGRTSVLTSDRTEPSWNGIGLPCPLGRWAGDVNRATRRRTDRTWPFHHPPLLKAKRFRSRGNLPTRMTGESNPSRPIRPRTTVRPFVTLTEPVRHGRVACPRASLEACRQPPTSSVSRSPVGPESVKRPDGNSMDSRHFITSLPLSDFGLGGFRPSIADVYVDIDQLSSSLDRCMTPERCGPPPGATNVRQALGETNRDSLQAMFQLGRPEDITRFLRSVFDAASTRGASGSMNLALIP